MSGDVLATSKVCLTKGGLSDVGARLKDMSGPPGSRFIKVPSGTYSVS